MEKQIKEQFHRAFNDLLEESLAGDKPDWDWVVKLYSELRDKLCQLTPNRADLHDEIKDSMDLDIFSQMIRNDVFKPDNVWALVAHVFKLIRERESVGRNKETDTIVKELHDYFISGATIATFVPEFLRQAHMRIDLINEDMEKFLATLNKK